MKKINVFISFLILIVICFALIASTGVDRPERYFEYSRLRTISNDRLSWETGISSFATSGAGTYESNCQDLIRQLGGDPSQAGQVRNTVGVLDFLGNQGWECICFVIEGSTGTYIFKRQI